jgi:hypothetical protein
MNYCPGTILYVTPYYFNNGDCQNKFFLILKNTKNNYTLASLPTSKDHIPEKHTPESGCVELPDIQVNCFVFSTKEATTTCGKKFHKRTHIYGNQIKLINDFHEIYPTEGKDFDVFGIMRPELFEKLRCCLLKSKIVKNKYKRILQL